MLAHESEKPPYFLLGVRTNTIPIKVRKYPNYVRGKVENIFKGSLDSIQSPSPSNYFNKPFVFKSLLTTCSNVLPLHLKQTFPPTI